ncbi:uncharacterized protein LOC107480819 [Arachis duranensis]|uniref:Uncharacterized protein LOC107480819 n=1 Tax=Arachis duranensis TaxID=130453 RepID=A0A6P4CTM4_ARADU|nr:uncharacterized protein LOC107480819 [Arachis duranensis]
MSKLISPAQCSFVPERQSADNILVAQEAIHSMRYKKGTSGYMAIKIDLEKVYDRLNWRFIQDTLQEAGLPQNLTDLIVSCYSSANMNVLWNGTHSNPFVPSRVKHNIWEPITLNRGGPKLLHLCFADDIVLFGKASMEQVELTRSILELFCRCSGQKVSYDKSCVYFSENVNFSRKGALSEALGASFGEVITLVLCSKYRCGDNTIPLMKPLQLMSNAWKGISHIWKQFERNIWRIGSGQTVDFWKHHWIPGVHCLMDFSQTEVTSNMRDEKVCDYVVNNNWNYDRIGYNLGDD